MSRMKSRVSVWFPITERGSPSRPVFTHSDLYLSHNTFQSSENNFTDGFCKQEQMSKCTGSWSVLCPKRCTPPKHSLRVSEGNSQEGCNDLYSQERRNYLHKDVWSKKDRFCPYIERCNYLYNEKWKTIIVTILICFSYFGMTKLLQ